MNILFRKRFSDLCYGFNAFHRDCLDRIVLDCTGFEIETQLCLRMQKAGISMVEVPSIEHKRIHGQSNLRTFRDGWRILKVIIHEWLHREPATRVVNTQYQVPTYKEAEVSLPTPEKVSL